MTKNSALRAKWILTAQEINDAMDQLYAVRKELTGEWDTQTLPQNYAECAFDQTDILEEIAKNTEKAGYRLPRTHAELITALKRVSKNVVKHLESDRMFAELSCTEQRDAKQIVRQIFNSTIASIGPR